MDLPAAISAALSVAVAVLAAAVALAGPARLARSVAVDGPRAAAVRTWGRRGHQDVAWERSALMAPVGSAPAPGDVVESDSGRC